MFKWRRKERKWEIFKYFDKFNVKKYCDKEEFKHLFLMCLTIFVWQRNFLNNNKMKLFDRLFIY